MARLFIVGLLNGEPSPFDGQWVSEYDPTRWGQDPDGKRMIAHLVTTGDPALAKSFATIADAEECWRQTHGLRRDGRPNRPLTAFVVEIQAAGRSSRLPVERPSLNQWFHTERSRVTFIAEFFYSS